MNAPQLVQALGEFEAGTYIDPHSGDPRPVTDNRQWQFAADSCMDVSIALESFLTEQGFAARRVWLGQAHHKHEQLDAAGYADPEAKLPDGSIASSQHCVVDVELDGEAWRVDFSALQYGYDEFPLVYTRAREDNAWERQPDFGIDVDVDAAGYDAGW